VISLDGWIAALPSGLFAAAFSLWGSPFTWLELWAFALSVAMVLANMRVWHGAWPLAIAASALYGVFFCTRQAVRRSLASVVFHRREPLGLVVLVARTRPARYKPWRGANTCA
jgi:hypothetical protein